MTLYPGDEEREQRKKATKARAEHLKDALVRGLRGAGQTVRDPGASQWADPHFSVGKGRLPVTCRLERRGGFRGAPRGVSGKVRVVVGHHGHTKQFHDREGGHDVPAIVSYIVARVKQEEEQIRLQMAADARRQKEEKIARKITGDYDLACGVLEASGEGRGLRLTLARLTPDEVQRVLDHMPMDVLQRFQTLGNSQGGINENDV